MQSFLKTFGKGILYFICLPVILLILIGYGLYLLGVFIFMAIKGIALFFKGQKYKFILPEDEQAELVLAGMMNATPAQPQPVQPQNPVTYNNTFNQINIHKNPEETTQMHEASFIDTGAPNFVDSQDYNNQTDDNNTSGYIEDNNNGGNNDGN